jgi:hypothetical protein
MFSEQASHRRILLGSLLAIVVVPMGAGCRSKRHDPRPLPPPADRTLSGAGSRAAGLAPAARSCPNRLPRAGVTCTSPRKTGCTADTDCPGPLGYCGPGLAVPSYDCECHTGCETDADCAPDQRCHCSPNLPAGLCVDAACRSDADCDGRRCLASSRIAGVGCGEANVGFHCQTPGDECASAADCGESSSCVFEAGRHLCQKNTVGAALLGQGHKAAFCG